MPFVIDPTQQQNQPGTPGMGQGNPLAIQAPITTSSAPGAGPGGAGPSGAAGNQAPAQPFTNLQAYLTANAPQIAGMAGQVAGQLGTGYSQTQSDIAAGKGGFEGAVAGGYSAPNQQAVNTAIQDAQAGSVSPTDISGFQAQANDVYTGPQNFEGSGYYQSLNKEIENAAQNASLVQTPAGLQNYLASNVETNPTAGETTLDTALLGSSPEAMSTIGTAASPYAALPGTLSNLVTTEDQGVQAAQAAAPQAATAANTALTGAVTGENQQIQNELNAAQGAFGTYNTDVGQLKGAAQDINTQIQNYLAANPNITVSGNTDFLAPWTNLANDTTAPTLASAASPQDFAILAALQQLGGNTSINPALTPDLASQGGTFALPQDLQAAINNGAVPAAMKSELGAMQNQITSAYAPLQSAEQAAYNWATYGQPAQTDLTTAQATLKSVTGSLASAQADPKTDPSIIQALQAQQAQLQNQIAQDQATIAQYPQASWDVVAPIAQNLQWLPQASTQYNDLLTKLQADISGLGGMSIPAYAPPTPSAIPKQASNAAGTAIGVGAPVGVGIANASGLAAGQTGSAADLAAAMGTTPEEAAALQAEEGGTSSVLGEGALSGVQAIGPAALAAYGTSNIVQNTLANPTAAGISDLANMGLSLATLSLPSNVLSSIGNAVTNVMDNIGKFFGNLF